jgi:hypothetical protein
VFCFFLPDTNARRPGLLAPGPSDLHLGAVHAEAHTLGGGVGEHIGQRAQPEFGLAGHGERTLGRQRPDLVHGPGDRGAVHLVEQGHRSVRQPEPRDDQRRDDPIDEHQLAGRARALGAGPVPAPTTDPRPGLLPRLPRIGQLHDQLGQPTPRDARTDTMRQGRASP